MKKIYSLIALLSAAIIFAQAGAPASPYWNGFNFNQTGMTLKAALATKITNTHTNQLTYSEVWDALKVTDRDPANTANVLLVYGWENGTDANVTNDHSRNKNDNGGSNGQWNREHTFAQALGEPDLGQDGPGADAHHLRACDVQRNGSRGNLKFASGSGVPSGVSGTGWYPGDEWKGDIARMMMYMYLHYGNQCLPTTIGIGSTVASDPNMITLFLQWNAEDPVSQYEDNRNTYLGSTSNTYGQGNRNPFIDNPYLATLIWGGTPAENRWPTLALPQLSDGISLVSVYPNPSNDNRINIDSEIIFDEIELISINGQLVQRIQHPVSQGDTYTIENLPQGFYFLKLVSDQQTTVKKVLIN
jgi:endonuclease I